MAGSSDVTSTRRGQAVLDALVDRSAGSRRHPDRHGKPCLIRQPLPICLPNEDRTAGPRRV